MKNSMTDKHAPAQPHDARVERILRAAEEHSLSTGEPEHQVGDLEGVLRAAWALMTPEQRNTLMAGADALDVLKAGDDYVEVAQLRGYLLDGHGVHRVVIEVTRDGGDAQPYLSSLKYYDAQMAEIDRHMQGINPQDLRLLAGRLDNEAVEAMPPQAPPAWTGTIDWDLQRDILTHSIKLRDFEVNVRPFRWLDASKALDGQRSGDSIDDPSPARVMVMELSQPEGNEQAGWVELSLNQTVLDNVSKGKLSELGGAASPVIFGVGAERIERDVGSASLIPFVSGGEWHVGFTALPRNAGGMLESGYVPATLFLQWHARRPPGEVLFVSKCGELLNERDDWERTHQWVEDYQRWRAPDFDEAQTEFEVERPNA